MSRHAVERHNDEFRLLYDRVVASLEAQADARPKTTAMEQAAELLGVTYDAVRAWLKPEGGKSASACPKWRVDMYRFGLPPELSRIADNTRDNLYTGLKALRDAGVMSEPTVKAFDSMARRYRRANA